MKSIFIVLLKKVGFIVLVIYFMILCEVFSIRNELNIVDLLVNGFYRNYNYYCLLVRLLISIYNLMVRYYC